MSTYRLSNLLAPRSVALVGASPRQGSLGAAILQNIRESGFAGAIGIVNPRYGEIAGMQAFSRIDEVPFAPELVVVTAPAREIPEIIDAAGMRGAAGAVIISAGLGHGPGSIAEATDGNCTSTCPPSIAARAGPLPRNGTWTRFTAAKSSSPFCCRAACIAGSTDGVNFSIIPWVCQIDGTMPSPVLTLTS